MTSAQQQGQHREVAGFNEGRSYPCPDCGQAAHFMGVDFKPPRRADVRAWRAVEKRIRSGQLFHRSARRAAPDRPGKRR